MKKLIYYPSFEVGNLAWLKFALLYIDELRPIIPDEGTKHLSDDFRRIMGESDLIKPYSPDYVDGMSATLDAIETVDKILHSPETYYDLLGGPGFIEEWKNPHNHTYTIFAQKYSKEWESYCYRNKFETRNNEGIAVHKSLGHLYMTLLANVISDGCGTPSITDRQDLGDISILAKKVDKQHNDAVTLAKNIIELQMPTKLDNVNIKEILKHRNRKEFKDRLHAFHVSLEMYQDELDKGTAEGGFLDKKYPDVKDFYLDLALMGIGLQSFFMSTWSVLQKDGANIEWSVPILTGTGSIIKGVHMVNKYWRHTKNIRLSRKYIADLSVLA